MKILLAGYYGAGNLGDELLLGLLIEWLRDAQHDVAVVTLDTAHTKARHGCIAIDRYDLAELVRQCEKADVFILGGGGLFQDHHRFTISDLHEYPAPGISFYAQLCLLARQLGVPYMLFAMGVGPLRGNDARAVTLEVFQHAAHVSVRDEASAALLREIGVRRDIEVGADPGWLMHESKRIDLGQRYPLLSGRRIVVVVPREWHFVQGWPEALVLGLKRLADAGWAILWLPFQASSQGNDTALVEELRSHLNPQTPQAMARCANPAEAAQIIASADALIAMRLHALIMGLHNRVPAIALEYDTKMAVLAESFPLDQALRLRLTDPPSRYHAAIDFLTAMVEQPVVGEEECGRKMLTAACLLRTALLAAIPKVPVRNAVDGWYSREYNWVLNWSAKIIGQNDSKIRFLERDNYLLRAELVEIKSSLRWLIFSPIKTTERALQIVKQDGLKVLISKARDVMVAAIRKSVLSNVSLAALLKTCCCQNSSGWLSWHTASRMLASSSARLTRSLKRAPLLLISKLPHGIRQPANSCLNHLSRTLRQATRGVIRIESEESNRWVGVANSSEKSAVITCAFEFDESVNQRPINYAKYLARNGYKVIFVSWQWSPRQVLSRAYREITNNIYEVPLFDFIQKQRDIDPRNDAKSLFCINIPSDAIVETHSRMRYLGFSVLYDIMDDWEGFSKNGQASWFDDAAEKSLVLSADLVSCVSPPLARKFENIRRDIEVHGNGYASSVLGMNSKGIARGADKRGVCAGYFGHLSEAWFDWDLLFEVAAMDRSVQFELIGYGAARSTLKRASAHPNIVFKGKIAPEELWKHAQFWTVGIIPFKQGTIAAATDPIKIYEYLYLGLPVVVTGIGHLSSYPNTRVAGDAPEFLRFITEPTAPARLPADEVDAFLEATTWDARFSTLTRSLFSHSAITDVYVA